MKCHICNRYLECKNSALAYVLLTCPEDHAQVILHNSNIVEYKVMWDDDPEAKTRYWIASWSCIPTLQFNKTKDKATIITSCSYGRPYKQSKILEFDYFTKLEIKNDTIEINSIIKKLKNLKAFI